MPGLRYVLVILLGWYGVSWAQPAQLINGNRTHAGATNYGLTTGTGAAYILTLNAAIPGYADGSCYLLHAHTANTGPATVNVNGRGARPLKKKVGAALVDLDAQDIVAGQLVEVCTDGTVMQTELGAAAGGDGSGGHLIQDEGVALTQRPALNFTGALLTCGDDAPNNRTVCSLAGAGTGTLTDIGSCTGPQCFTTGTPSTTQWWGTRTAPATPAAGQAVLYIDTASQNLSAKNDAGTVTHGVQTKTQVPNEFVVSIAPSGGVTSARPALANLSDAAQVVTLTGAQRLSNKQVNPREVPVSGTTVTPDLDQGSVFVMNTMPGNVTLNCPIGTGGNPVPGHAIEFRFLATTPRTLTWNACYAAEYAVALPTITQGDGVTYDRVTFVYNSNSTKWGVVAALPLSGGGGGHLIQEEGVGLTQRPTLNFTGALLTCGDDPPNNRTVCSLAGAGTGTLTHMGSCTGPQCFTTGAPSTTQWWGTSAAPATPSAGQAVLWVDTTSKNLALKNDAGTVTHGVQTKTAIPHEFVVGLTDTGALTTARPTLANLADAATVVTLTGTQRLSNKQVNPREVPLAGTNITPDLDQGHVFVMNTMPGNVTLNCPAGTGGNPVPGHEIEFRFLSTTPRTLTWNACYAAEYAVTLPTTTRGDGVTYDRIKFVYNTNSAKWGLVAVLPIAGGGSGHLIQEEGVGLTQRPTLNFTGTLLTCGDDPPNNRTVCSLAGAGTGTLTHMGSCTGPQCFTTGAPSTTQWWGTSAAPATPSAGQAVLYVDTTSKNLALKNDAGTITHGVQSKTAIPHEFVVGLTDAGVLTTARPTLANLSDAASVVTLSGAQRLSNKQVNPREVVLSGTPVTPDLDQGHVFLMNTMPGNVTLNCPSGTGGNPVPGHEIEFRFLSATPRTLTWNACYAAEYNLALPTVTRGDGITYDRIKFVYNSNSAKWGLVAALPLAGGTLTVQEIDGTPTGSFSTLKFSNGAMTDNGDGSATIITGAGGGGNVSSSGTPTSGQIASWVNATTIQGLATVPLGSGGLGTALADPGGHRLLGWDDTDNVVRLMLLGTGLTYTPATDTLAVAAASQTVVGAVELATTAETTSGTSAALAVTPQGLAQSVFGEKTAMLEVVADGADVTTGDGQAYLPMHVFAGWVVVGVSAHVGAAVSSSGAVNVDLDVCGAVATGIRCSGTNRDLLSTNLTIDANEDGSETAASAAVINTANDDLAAGEWLRVNIDAAGTGTKGLYLTVTLRRP